jgi:hypothetical protein
VLSLSLAAAALALFSSTPSWAQNTGNQTPPAGVGQANPANAGRPMERKFVEAEGNDKFIVTDLNGRNEYTHTLDRDAQVMCDGRACKLSDLKRGTLIRVWHSPTDKEMVIKVEATTKGRFENQPGGTDRPGTTNRPQNEVNRR